MLLTVNSLLRDIEASPNQATIPDAHGWARPFVYGDPAALPPRRWLYEPHYIRNFMSVTIAPGGLGKSTLALTEAIAIATGVPSSAPRRTRRARSGTGTVRTPTRKSSVASTPFCSTTASPRRKSRGACSSVPAARMNWSSLPRTATRRPSPSLSLAR